MTYLELAVKVIREEKRPLTTNEIWDTTLSKQYDKLLTSVGKTPWATIGARIYVDMRDNPSSNFIKLDGERPVRLFLKDLGKDYQVKVQNNEKNVTL